MIRHGAQVVVYEDCVHFELGEVVKNRLILLAPIVGDEDRLVCSAPFAVGLVGALSLGGTGVSYRVSSQFEHAECGGYSGW